MLGALRPPPGYRYDVDGNLVPQCTCPRCVEARILPTDRIFIPPPADSGTYPADTITFDPFETITPDSFRQSWECLRCRRINAPHVDQCSCYPHNPDGSLYWPDENPELTQVRP